MNPGQSESSIQRCSGLTEFCQYPDVCTVKKATLSFQLNNSVISDAANWLQKKKHSLCAHMLFVIIFSRFDFCREIAGVSGCHHVGN